MNKPNGYLFAILLCFLCSGIFAQNKPAFDGPSWKPPYTLELEGWRIERFPIPVDFAPSIDYKGVEDLRFTKGWADQNSDEYWSYAFLWLLEGSSVQSALIIQKNLNTYYDGLIARNIIKRNIPKGLVFKTNTQMRRIETGKGDQQTFSGTIKMLDYMAQKPILLHVKVHVKRCPGSTQTIVFYQLSPQHVDQLVWRNLNALWTGFSCQGHQ